MALFFNRQTFGSNWRFRKNFNDNYSAAVVCRLKGCCPAIVSSNTLTFLAMPYGRWYISYNLFVNELTKSELHDQISKISSDGNKRGPTAPIFLDWPPSIYRDAGHRGPFFWLQRTSKCVSPQNITKILLALKALAHYPLKCCPKESKSL